MHEILRRGSIIPERSCAGALLSMLARIPGVIRTYPGTPMNFELFAHIPIFRPSLDTERLIRQEVETHLRARYAPGQYTEPGEITAILNYMFDYYYERLGQLLPAIASLRLLNFILHEYENTAAVEDLYKRGQLDGEEMDTWLKLGPGLRRGLKYLAERITILEPVVDLTPGGDLPFPEIEQVLVFAEELVKLYTSSDLTHSIAPNTTVLEIFPPGGEQYMRLDPHTPALYELPERARRDTFYRDRFVPETSIVYDVSAQAGYLNDSFVDHIDTTYQQAMEALEVLTNSTAELPPVMISPRETILQNVSRFRHMSERAADLTLQGFTISRSTMEDRRQLFRPKQEYRAYRRGFFEVAHPDGPHLAFSSSMASEALTTLRAGVAFKRLPPEWCSPQVMAALERISNEAGKWFESVVQDALINVGLRGVAGRRSLGRGAGLLRIPEEVGEIDYLGYSEQEQLLVVAECKCVNEGSEPKYFRDSLDDFVWKAKSYRTQFLRKIEWVQQKALATESDLPRAVTPTRLATTLITLYPSIATHFITDFPCRSITELMLDYEGKGKWPYANGVFQC